MFFISAETELFALEDCSIPQLKEIAEVDRDILTDTNNRIFLDIVTSNDCNCQNIPADIDVDQESGKLNTEITVIDINDNPPVFQNGGELFLSMTVGEGNEWNKDLQVNMDKVVGGLLLE